MVKVIKTPLADVVLQAMQDKQNRSAKPKRFLTGSNRDRATESATMTQKRCAVCGKVKKIDEFHRRRKGSDVRSSRCGTCAANAQRVWRRNKRKAEKAAASE